MPQPLTGLRGQVKGMTSFMIAVFRRILELSDCDDDIGLRILPSHIQHNGTLAATWAGNPPTVGMTGCTMGMSAF